MNRAGLIRLLANHASWVGLDGVACTCGFFRSGTAEAWARHVASVIYPETVGSDATMTSGVGC